MNVFFDFAFGIFILLNVADQIEEIFKFNGLR